MHTHTKARTLTLRCQASAAATAVQHAPKPRPSGAIGLARHPIPPAAGTSSLTTVSRTEEGNASGQLPEHFAGAIGLLDIFIKYPAHSQTN